MSGPPRGLAGRKTCTRQHGWALGELAVWEQREGGHMDMQEDHDPEASIMLRELQTRDLVLGGTKQSFAAQLGKVWHSVQEQDLRGESQPR